MRALRVHACADIYEYECEVAAPRPASPPDSSSQSSERWISCFPSGPFCLVSERRFEHCSLPRPRPPVALGAQGLLHPVARCTSHFLSSRSEVQLVVTLLYHYNFASDNRTACLCFLQLIKRRSTEIAKFSEERSVMSACHAEHKEHESVVFMCEMRPGDRAGGPLACSQR